MATQTTGGGSTTSFSNTPQAQDDAFAWTEDQLKSSGLYNVNTNTITLDVMANDLGGKAKTLWSIDDGGTDAMSELLKSNVTTSWEKTAAGNWMRICDGKVEFRLDDGSHTAGSARSLDSLTAADRVQDSFVYAIRLGNGTLSYAKVTVDISGQNDAAELGGKFTGDVTEAGGTNNNNTGTPSASGTVAVYDVDVGEKHFKAVSDAALKGTYGNFSFNPTTGEWSYTLENGREATQGLKAGQVMTETLKVWSADGAASKDIVVTVNGTNDAPVVSGAVTGGATEGGAAVTINALANSTDVDDNTTLQVTNLPAQLPAGVTYDAATHSFTLDPTHTAYNHLADGQPTTVTVNYAVSDGITSTPATVTWTVTGTNDAPAVSGAVTGGATEGGSAVTLNALANASDVDDNTTLQVAGVPAQLPAGVTYDAATHSFTLDPTHTAYNHLADGQPTTVTVNYAVSDGITSTPATVTWTVTGTNDAPAVSGAVTGGATEGGSAVTLNALANASDVDDNTTLQVAGVPAQLPAGVTYDAATHSFTLDPTHTAYNHLADGQPTTVTVNYAVSDGITSTPATVTWTVTGTNDAPAVSGAVTGGATEGGSAVTLNALANASDVDDNTTLQVAGVPAQLPAGVTYDAATHSFTLDPTHTAYNHLADGQPTTVTVNYAVSDGITSTPATVTWTVTGTNDAPAVSGAVTGGATEGGSAVTLNALANASDVDDNTTLQVAGVPAQLPAGVTYDAATHSFTLDPTHTAYNHLADGQPTTVTVNYAVSDGITSTPATVTWTVTGTNDAPAVSGAVTGGATEGGSAVTLNALANASDVDDNTTLQVAGVPAQLPAGVTYDAATHSFTLDPTHTAYNHLADGQPTTVTVNYAVSDGITSTPATVTWTVTGTNDAPAVSGAVTGGATEGGSAVTLNALANASDVDDNTTLQVAGVPAQLPAGVTYDAATHSFTLDPTHTAYNHLADGQPTTVTVNYAVSDGITSTPATVTWTVTGTNDAPAVSGAVTGGATEGGSAVTLNALANASDVDDNTTLQVAGVPAQLPAGVTYDAATHSFTLDPTHTAYNHLADGQPTTVTVNYAVSDGITSTPATVTWTVTGTNDAPAVSGAVTGGATEGGSAVTLNALANASDVDDNTTLQVAGVPAQLPAGVTYDAATHSFTLDPTHTAYNHLADGQPTTVTVNYAVSDGITSTPATVTWTVTGTNDAPTNTVPGAQTINSNTTTAIAGVAVADVDSANVSTTVSVAHGKLAVGTGGGVTVSNNATATVTISGTLTQVNAALAALSYVSDTNYGGTDTLTVTTSDGSLGDTDTVALTVNAPANQAPDAPTFAFNPGSVSGDDGNKLASGTVLGAFAAVDPNGDPLTYSFSGGTTTGLALNPTAGALTLTSDLNNQDLTFNVVATDSHGNQSVSTTVRVWIGNAGGNGQTFTNNSGTIIAFGLNQEDTITIVAGSGHDALVGGAGDDSLSGGGGNDWLSGGAGDDVLNGGSGSNILIGGAGGDTFDFGNFGATANHVTDFEAGTSSTTVDKLRFDVGTGAGEFSVGNNDLTVNNFKSGNNAAINVAGTEIAVKTDASVTNASVQSTINSYGNITSGAFFVFHNSDLGHAAVYYDPNPSAAGGAILVTELDNVTLLGNLGNLNAGDFQFS